ncbi:MAG: hypothetical protein R2712_06175 [Vicinamibacterales bacterium]
MFRTGINFVRVDVIVTDRQGQPVADLTPGRLRSHRGRQAAGRRDLPLREGRHDGARVRTRTIRTREDEEIAASDENARIFVFFLDGYNVRLGNGVVGAARHRRLRPDAAGAGGPGGGDVPADAARRGRLTPSPGRRPLHRALRGRKFRYEPRNQIERQCADQPTEIVRRIRRQVSLSR